jgi:hypothetical protein
MNEPTPIVVWIGEILEIWLNLPLHPQDLHQMKKIKNVDELLVITQHSMFGFH